MSTLIVHPKDKSTDFLKKIYTPLANKTVITGGINRHDLRELIENHERIIMLGHGTPYGLLSVCQFPRAGNYIVDWSMVDLLSQKKDSIYVWCHAEQFVKNNQLMGFFSGMFISEFSEAIYYDFWDLEQKTIDKSNQGFAEIVSRYINEPLNLLFKNVIQEYGILAKSNPIAQFNMERLYINSDMNVINSICKTVPNQYGLNNIHSKI